MTGERFVRVDRDDWKNIIIQDIDHIMLRKDHTRMLIMLKSGNIVDVKIKSMKQYRGHYLDDIDMGIEP